MGKFSKLTSRYFGPFEILEKIGLVAYELALPPNINVHNVRNVIEWNMTQENCDIDVAILH